MNFNTYQAEAMRTAKRFPNLLNNLVHAQLGLLTEAGEFATEVKRAAIYGRPLDVEAHDHMREELGDILWYLALAAESLDLPLGMIARDNLEKLRKRFPEQYTDSAAEARLDKGGLGSRES